MIRTLMVSLILVAFLVGVVAVVGCGPKNPYGYRTKGTDKPTTPPIFQQGGGAGPGPGPGAAGGPGAAAPMAPMAPPAGGPAPAPAPAPPPPGR